MLHRELRVKLTHDTKFKCGSVVSLSFIFTNPPEDETKKKKRSRGVQDYGVTYNSSSIQNQILCANIRGCICLFGSIVGSDYYGPWGE